MAGSRPEASRTGFAARNLKAQVLSRHSSVVEHVIGNDGVDCSIQSGGTTIFQQINILLG